MKFSIKTQARGCGANGPERKLMSDGGSTVGPSLSLSYSVSLLRKQAGRAGNAHPLPTPSPRISSETARAITGCSPLPYPKLPVKVSLSPQPPVSRKHPSAMSLAKTSETSHRNEQFHALYKQNLGRSGLHTRPPPGELTKEPHPVQLLNGLSHPS